MPVSQDMGRNDIKIKSFTVKCLVTKDEVYFIEPSPRMMAFFGTTEESYKGGVLARIRRDIGADSADALARVMFKKAAAGEDFRIVYPSMRADGSRCTMQLDGYAARKTDEGCVYDVIEMDISELMETRSAAEKLTSENKALMEDSPVGLGIYHIKDNRFDLVYTNAEYYKVHHGSREFWHNFSGRDALDRIYAEDHKAIFEEWQKTLKSGSGHVYNASYRCIGEDGELHWIRLLARLTDENEAGERVCYACYLDIDNEKKAEELARQLSKSLLDTINSLPTPAALFRIGEGNHLHAKSYSEDICRLLGYTQEEAWRLFGDNGLSVVHPDDLAPLLESYATRFREEKTNLCMFRVLTKDGSYKWLNANCSYFSVGSERYMYILYTDIDDVKKREEQLEKEYSTAQSFLDSVSGSYHSTRRVNITQNLVEMVSGVNPTRMVKAISDYDKSIVTLLTAMPREQDRKACAEFYSREFLTKAYENGERTLSRDYQVRAEDGRVHWMKSVINLSRRPGSGDLISFSAVSDISEARTVEMILNDVVVKQYDFISCIDADNNSIELVSVNRQSAAVGEVHGGANYDAIMREYVDKHVVPEEKESCAEFMNLSNVMKALEKSEIYSGSFTVEEGGLLRNKKLDFSYIDRESRLITLIRTDFTEMQKKQLEQEEKLRSALTSARAASVAKSEFLSRMSHEIRTPMNAIIGLDTIALQEKDLAPAMEDHLKKIGISARFLLSLINDILDMSRIESGKMLLKSREFDFRGFIDNINAILYPQCRDRGIDYECVVSGVVDEAYVGDETKLQQVLLNILGNSVKFTQSGGKIHFMIEQLSHDQTNARLRFTIADTGKGIDPDFMPHIFDAFSQEDVGTTSVYGGTGLGLAISRNIVRLMDGSIDVHSIKGMGTDFTVEIGLGLSEISLAWNKEIPSAALASLKTLIVDDDVIICQHTELVLTQAGMKAEWVDSGAAAVERVRERRKTADDYDLILVDWKMPDMDGLETARRIRTIVGPDVTIIILTSYDWSDIELKARAAGVDDFLRKPVFASSVIQAYNDKRSNAVKQPDKSVKDAYNFKGLNVLLAEDNAINAEIASSLLSMAGFAVDTVANGVEAIQAFTKSPDGHYAAILMDIRMPLMDGLEATRIIRSIRKKDSKSVPIVAMSANAFEEDVHKSLDCGMNAHLTKPVEAAVMFETLGKLIKQAKKK